MQNEQTPEGQIVDGRWGSRQSSLFPLHRLTIARAGNFGVIGRAHVLQIAAPAARGGDREREPIFA